MPPDLNQSIKVNKAMEFLIQQLADGAFHSGEGLGKTLGISRAAVWKHIKSLDSLGIHVESVKGKGYRMPDGLDLLDASVLKLHINKKVLKQGNDIFTFKTLDSTNTWLLERIESGIGNSGDVCLAEQQSAGRGRRGRHWVSPFGCNFYGSFLWKFEKGLNALEGLSLSMAVAVADALDSLGVPDVALKWPNDILVREKKLAGILLEVRGDLTDRCDVVVGVGVNFSMPPHMAVEIDQDWIDVQSLIDQVIDRNKYSAVLIEHVLASLREFDEEGFAAFMQRWTEKDACRGYDVNILAGKDVCRGKALGVNAQGAFLLDCAGKIRSFHGGEVSLRKV